jgi:lipoprotein-releasing system ATP-binding protein
LANPNHNPAADPILQAQGLCKRYVDAGKKPIEILHDADLRLMPGETLAIVGASGIGKSTLLHLLGTLDRPDSGALYFQGRNLFAMDDAGLAQFRNRAIGFVFQFHHLLPEFTALENVMMPGLIQGLTQAQSRRHALDILERVGLAHRLSHRVTELSGGEQQRVALARALVQKPLVLLADEPTGNLDRENSTQVHQLLKSLNHDLGLTVVVVTHNPDLADLMDHCVTISQGRLVEQG